MLRGQCPHLSPLDPQITADLLSNGIDVYPQKEFDEDSEDRLVNEKFRVSGPTRMPFPEASHFLLEDMGGGLPTPSRASGETGGKALSHENVIFWARRSRCQCPHATFSGQGS